MKTNSELQGLELAPEQQKAGLELPWQTLGELFARVNQTGADSGIALVSQAFKDLV